MKNVKYKIHFVGIGGVGMSGIAEILHNLGHIVTGSDTASNYNTDRLSNLGIHIYIGHFASNIDHSDVVVASTAINANNLEIQEAKRINIPVLPRAMMLAELMRFKSGIAIAGAHGKTTTTSLCAEVLSICGLDPTFVIGGKLATTGSNAKLGLGEYLVAEADESDASFLYLNPMLAVVTNIDLDHMDTYGHSVDKLKQTFIDFLLRLPFYGKAIVCNEDERIREILPQISRPIIRYGLDDSCDIYATNIKPRGIQMEFELHIPNRGVQRNVLLNLSGVHNVLNSLSVVAVALECDCDLDKILLGLAGFHGVGRRCQVYPEIKYNNISVLLIDDYGHHPTELRVTLDALKIAYPDKRIVLVFQPHRYTRTHDLFDDFVTVLSFVDILILHEIYAAGEIPINGCDTQHLLNSINAKRVIPAVFVSDLESAKLKVLEIIQNNDLVLTMGAGSIGKLPQIILDSVNKREI